MKSIEIDDIVRLSDSAMAGRYFTPDCNGIVDFVGRTYVRVEWSDGRTQGVPKNNLTIVREEPASQLMMGLPDDMRLEAERDGLLEALRTSWQTSRSGKKFLLHSVSSPLARAANDLAAEGLISIHELGVYGTLRIELED